LIRRLLIVPIVFDEAQIVIARPDDGDHEQLPVLLLVAKGLKLLCVVEDILGKIREAVYLDSLMAVKKFLLPISSIAPFLFLLQQKNPRLDELLRRSKTKFAFSSGSVLTVGIRLVMKSMVRSPW